MAVFTDSSVCCKNFVMDDVAFYAYFFLNNSASKSRGLKRWINNRLCCWRYEELSAKTKPQMLLLLKEQSRLKLIIHSHISCTNKSCYRECISFDSFYYTLFNQQTKGDVLWQHFNPSPVSSPYTPSLVHDMCHLLISECVADRAIYVRRCVVGSFWAIFAI